MPVARATCMRRAVKWVQFPFLTLLRLPVFDFNRVHKLKAARSRDAALARLSVH
jgi:hypothetical protein